MTLTTLKNEIYESMAYNYLYWCDASKKAEKYKGDGIEDTAQGYEELATSYHLIYLELVDIIRRTTDQSNAEVYEDMRKYMRKHNIDESCL